MLRGEGEQRAEARPTLGHQASGGGETRAAAHATPSLSLARSVVIKPFCRFVSYQEYLREQTEVSVGASSCFGVTEEVSRSESLLSVFVSVASLCRQSGRNSAPRRAQSPGLPGLPRCVRVRAQSAVGANNPADALIAGFSLNRGH